MTTAEAFQIGQMEDVPRDISSPLLFDGVTTDYVFFLCIYFLHKADRRSKCHTTLEFLIEIWRIYL